MINTIGKSVIILFIRHIGILYTNVPFVLNNKETFSPILKIKKKFHNAEQETGLMAQSK